MFKKHSKNLKEKLFFLFVILLFTFLFSLVFMQNNQVQASGSGTSQDPWDISENNDNSVTAILSDDGTLTISGTSNMKNYMGFNSVPWNDVKDKIKKIIINNGVTNIGNYAFNHCSELISVTIPNSITSIGRSALYSCSSLASITIPNSVTSIDKFAFFGCSSLTDITIPDSVTSIGDYTFYGCSSLTIQVYKDSYAEEYVKDNNLNFQTLDTSGGNTSDGDTSDDNTSSSTTKKSNTLTTISTAKSSTSSKALPFAGKGIALILGIVISSLVSIFLWFKLKRENY